MGTLEGIAPREHPVVLVIEGAGGTPSLVDALAAVETAGRRVQVCASAREGLAFLDTADVNVLVVSLDTADMPGLPLIQAVLAERPSTPVIAVTAAPTVEGAVAAVRAGAADYLGHSYARDALANAIGRALSHERGQPAPPEITVAERYGFKPTLTRGPRMTRVFDAMRAVAQTDATVLIRGEAGTGTELVASGIHERSRRRNKPLVGVNCGALTEAELVTELFGHARTDEPGAFEQAEGGTLFLDELGQSSLSVQVQLLRVLEEQRVRRIGGTEVKKVNVRLIAANDFDLEGAVADGRFREDLYYRLNVFPIALPPLRERLEDIPLLVRHFLDGAAREYDLPAPQVTPDAMELLTRYRWPGNVRQLRARCERWVIECRGAPLGTDALPEKQVGLVPPPDAGVPLFVDASVPLAVLTERLTTLLERTYLHKLLAHHGGHLQNTATAAGMTRRTLYSRMKALGIDAKDYK